MSRSKNSRGTLRDPGLDVLMNIGHTLPGSHCPLGEDKLQKSRDFNMAVPIILITK